MRSRWWGGALCDDPNNGCEGDYEYRVSGYEFPHFKFDFKSVSLLMHCFQALRDRNRWGPERARWEAGKNPWQITGLPYYFLSHWKQIVSTSWLKVTLISKWVVNARGEVHWSEVWETVLFPLRLRGSLACFLQNLHPRTLFVPQLVHYVSLPWQHVGLGKVWDY